MKVRLKTGEFVTLTPELFFVCQGVEEPEKLKKWKKEYTRELVKIKQDKLDMERRAKVDEDAKSEMDREKEILDRLKKHAAQNTMSTAARVEAEVSALTGRPVKKGSFIDKVFGQKEDKDGNDPT